MPQPRRAQQPPPPEQEASATTTGATAAAGTAAVAAPAAAAPAAASAAGVALTAAAVARAVTALVRTFAGLLRRRGDEVYAYTLGKVEELMPDADRGELTELARRERDYEVEFHRKALRRLRRDLPLALRITDPVERRRRVEVILDRERRYVRQREEAMITRAQAAAEISYLRDSSPDGAYWKLSAGVREHTLDCLAMGEKFWPWSVLNRIHPPLHHGCPCRLFGKADAISRGWMGEEDVPDTADAERRAREVERLIAELDEAGVDDEDLTEHLDLLEAAERWGKGHSKGGQFKPRRGGTPGRPTGRRGGRRRRALARVLPRLPKPPAETRGDGRWVWIDGKLTHVPEGRWEREQHGRKFTSPAGGTNVYLDGELVSEVGKPPTHPAVKRRGGRREADLIRPEPVPEELVRALNAALSATRSDADRHRKRAERAVVAMRDDLPPVDAGDGPAALEGLEMAGFRVTEARTDGSLELTHPQGGRVRVAFDGDTGRVAATWWTPRPAEVVPRVASDGPPATPEALLSDTLALADELGREHGAPVVATGAVFAPELEDHAGEHTWGGQIRLGVDAARDVEAAAAARAEGRELTEDEARGAYSAQWVAAHEAAHAVNPIRPEDFTGAHRSLEEALAEEAGQVLARRRLAAQGQREVLEWAESNPDALPVAGLYRRERHTLAGLLDRAGVPDTREDRERVVLDLAFGTPPEERLDRLAGMLAQAGAFPTAERALEHTELSLGDPTDVDDLDFRRVVPDGRPERAPRRPPVTPEAPDAAEEPTEEVRAPQTAAVAAVEAFGGATLAALVEEALGSGALADSARWELAHRAAVAPGSPESRAIRQALPDLPEATVAPLLAEDDDLPRERRRLTPVAPRPSASVGYRLDSAEDRLQEADGPFGRGAHFVSGREDSTRNARPKHRFPVGVPLEGTALYRARDAEDADRLAVALAEVRDYAAGADVNPVQLADRLPVLATGERDSLRVQAALEQVRGEREGSGERGDAATRLMQLLGYDGVDTRHIPEWDSQDRGSVVYPDAGREPPMETGAVVGGRAGRWVWIRGVYRHIPEGEDWEEVVDGVRFSSPAGGTQVFRQERGPRGEFGPRPDDPQWGPPELVARPRWNGHPDVRNPQRGGTTRGARRPQPPAPPTRDDDDGRLQPGTRVVVDIPGHGTVGGNVFQLVGTQRYAVRLDDRTLTSVHIGSARVPGAGEALAWRVGQPVSTPDGPGVIDRLDTDRNVAVVRDADGSTREVPASELADGRLQLGWRVRHLDPAVRNGVEGVVLETLPNGQVRIEMPNGAPSDPIDPADLEVIDRGTPLPEVGPTITDEDMGLLRVVDAPAADGAEVVPGVRYRRAGGVAVFAEDGHVEVGPAFFALTAGARTREVDAARGFGLAVAIDGDDAARQRFSQLWTDSRFGDLSTLDLHEGIAEGYARLRELGWREDATRFPDALRAVALEAHDRGFPVDPEVRAWALGQQIGGPGLRPPAPNAAQAIADRLDGLDRGQIADLLNGEGFYRLTGSGSDGRQAWRKFTPDGLLTVHYDLVREGAQRVPRNARGTFDPHDPSVAADDPVVRFARTMVGEPWRDAESSLVSNGWVRVASDFAASGTRIVWGRPTATGDDRHRVIVTKTTGGYPNQTVEAARAGTATPDEVDLIAHRRIADDPERAEPGDSRQAVTLAMSRAGFTPQGEGGEWVTYRKVTNRNTENATVEEWRFRFNEDRLVAVGRPTDIPGGFADDAGYQQRVAREAEALRAAHREQRERRDAIKERVRARLNARQEPFDGGESYDDVLAVLRELGYSSGNPRTLQGDRQSVTFKNRDLGNKLILRLDRPDADGKRKVLANTRLELRAIQYGRERVRGRAPANVDEFTGDAFGRGVEIAERFGVTSDVRRIEYVGQPGGGRSPSDHGGTHYSDGRVVAGRQVHPDLQAAFAARAAGRPLTEAQKRGLYTSYRVMQHELLHGAYRQRGAGYVPAEGTKGIEEALVEELSHVYAIEWLNEHGFTDVTDWHREQVAAGRRNDVWALQGVYTRHRQNFRTVMDVAGIPQADRRAWMERHKFQGAGPNRLRNIAQEVAANQGWTEDRAVQWVRNTMRGNTSSLPRTALRSFQPLLEPDYTAGRGGTQPPPARREPPAEPPARPEPPQPPPVAQPPVARPGAAFRVGERVRGRPLRGRAFQGRIVAIGAGDHEGQVKIRKIGRGEEVWIAQARVAYLDGTRPGGPPPAQPPPGQQPPPQPPTGRPTGPTATLQNGGKVAVGSWVHGRVSGKLSVVTAITPEGRVSIRRTDGSTYTANRTELDAIVINDEGRHFTINQRVRTPDGEEAVIRAIDWTDVHHPKVQLTAGGPWVEARPLTEVNPQPVVSIRKRNGRGEVPLNPGDVAQVGSDRVRIIGRRALLWPDPTRTVISVANVEGGLADRPRNVTPEELRLVGEPPSPPREFRPDADTLQRLATQHYERSRSAGATAELAARDLAARMGQPLATWARDSGKVELSNGNPVYRGTARPPEALFALAYRDAFSSKRDHDAFKRAHPELYGVVMGIAGEAGMHWPNWGTRVPPAPPIPPTPPGTMFDEAVLRHAWTGQFGRKGQRAEVRSVHTNGRNEASIEGVILNARGTQIGHFTRRVTLRPDGTPTVYHAYLKITSKTNQGGGFASAFNKHAEGVYRAKGVKQVTVSANLDVGGYTWAATGFNWHVESGLGASATPQQIAEARARQCASFFRSYSRRANLTAEQQRAFEERLWNGTEPLDPTRHLINAWDFAAMPGAKQMMLGTSWSGIKHLVGPDRSPFAG